MTRVDAKHDDGRPLRCELHQRPFNVCRIARVVARDQPSVRIADAQPEGHPRHDVGATPLERRRTEREQHANRSSRHPTTRSIAGKARNFLAGATEQRAGVLEQEARKPDVLLGHRKPGKMMGKGAPDAAELEKMQAELAGLDPNALPEDLKDMMKGGSLPSMPGLPGLGAGKLPGLGNLPGLGGNSPFKGLPGFGKKK